MYQLNLSQGMKEVTEHDEVDNILTILSSEELEERKDEDYFINTPSANGVHSCKAEPHHTYLCGTIMTPCYTKEHHRIAFGYLLTNKHMILCDDSELAYDIVLRAHDENEKIITHTGGMFYSFLVSLVSKDSSQLQAIEERLSHLEEEVLSGELDKFDMKMINIRKKLEKWIKYYTQLEDMIGELQKNDNQFFDKEDLRRFRLLENKVGRLKNETQVLREYSLQIREVFQAQIGIKQNHIMKILTIITTIFLPLTLVTGWYGMNFKYMPELAWRYGYIVVICISFVIILFTLWIMKKKKFW